VLTAREQLKPLMAQFPFTSCVPFSNNTPLADRGRERSGVLFRAASHEAPPDEVLAALERILGLDAQDVLRYADRKKGQRRTVRLVRKGDAAELAGFVLAGDTSAQAWMKTLLQDELPAQAYGRLLLLPGAKPPVAVQSRGKPVCTCFNVSDTAIDEHLAMLAHGGGGTGHLHTDEERLASLQATLRCGTNCGSCVPELKRRVRSARAEAPVLTAPPRTVIPIRQLV
jgi:assimilatory nitrate reductase catalytic subunit